jgi:heptosyltransferase-2
MNKPSYHKFLLIQTAFLGDVILFTSLLEKIHHYYPNAEIKILIKKGSSGIFENHPYVKEVWEMDKSEKGCSAVWGWIKRIRKEKFDVVINAHRYFRSGLLTAFSGALHIAGYKENPFSFMFNHTARFRIGDGTHEVERLNGLVEDFLGKEIFKPKLYPSVEDSEKIKQISKEQDYICFAPGSVWKTKQLPLEKWVELGKKIKNKKIFILGSSDDIELGDEILNQLSKDNIRGENVCGKLTILQTAALMSKATMNYVNDSAPLHMASAMNAPVTVFYCSTVPEFGFYPLSDHSKILQVEGLSCRPCGIHGKNKCPKGHFDCGKINLDLNV